MATRRLVVLTSDLDGDDADETVRFGLDGQVYEIDLTGYQAEEMRDMIGGYARAGRKVAAPAPAAGQGTGAWGKPLGPPKARRIRKWGREVGVAINQYGRIPTQIVWQYEASTGDV